MILGICLPMTAVISQLSADVVEQFIDRITVWPGKKIEISWKD